MQTKQSQELDKILTKEVLTELYVNQKKKIRVITRELGIKCPHSVENRLQKYGLYKRVNRNNKLVLTKEYLIDNYVNQGKSMHQIGIELGLKSRTSVKQALIKYGIPIDHDCQRNRRGKPCNSLRKGYREISGSYWCSKKFHALNGDKELAITIEEAWDLFIQQDRKCALSGVELRFATRWTPKGRLEQTASLDRIDSSKGYIPGNVQWIHKELQNMKWDKPDLDFIRWCVKVSDHSGYRV